MKVNIGKNTLGDNNKMSLSLREYGRSTHDLSFAWRSTMSVGTLVPFLKILALPGDTFEIKMENKILTAPTLGPLFGSFKFQADIFTCPIRLYNAMLHNNALKIGLDMAKVKLPQIKFGNTVNESLYFGGFSTSSLKNFLEYREVRDYNAVPVLAYYDIFKNYYANKQEDYFAMYSGVTPVSVVISNSGLEGDTGQKKYTMSGTQLKENDCLYATYQFNLSGGGTLTTRGTNLAGVFNNTSGTQWTYKAIFVNDTISNFVKDWADVEETISNKNQSVTEVKVLEGKSTRKIESFKLEEIDDLREYILSKGKQQITINESNNEIPKFIKAAIDNKTCIEDLGGLCLKTYLSDINNNWINSEWIDGDNGISKITSIDTSSGSFSIDTINLAKKVYEMLNRIAISGGTYKDWIETVYTTDYYFRAETPVYEGGMSSEIVFEEIVSNSASAADGYEPLGTLAGRGINSNERGGNIVIKVNEPCYIMGIASITPRVDYSQGVAFDLDLKTLNDIHKPQLDGIGFEDRMLRRLDWRAKGESSLGKQPAWIEYTTNINKTFGKFAVGESQEHMVLNRVYQTKYDSEISNASTYIQPELYNKIFATTGNQEQNFWVQIGCGIEARRVMSARQIPIF